MKEAIAKQNSYNDYDRENSKRKNNAIGSYKQKNIKTNKYDNIKPIDKKHLEERNKFVANKQENFFDVPINKPREFNEEDIDNYDDFEPENTNALDDENKNLPKTVITSNMAGKVFYLETSNSNGFFKTSVGINHQVHKNQLEPLEEDAKNEQTEDLDHQTKPSRYEEAQENSLEKNENKQYDKFDIEDE